MNIKTGGIDKKKHSAIFMNHVFKGVHETISTENGISARSECSLITVNYSPKNASPNL